MSAHLRDRRSQRRAARRGRLHLARGTIETPVFMPVGTYGRGEGNVTARTARSGRRNHSRQYFHLWLRPGLEVVAKHNGLHRFIGWPRPILTDSGGFQVFSLDGLRKISEEGVLFALPDQRRPTHAHARGVDAHSERAGGRRRDGVRRMHAVLGRHKRRHKRHTGQRTSGDGHRGRRVDAPLTCAGRSAAAPNSIACSPRISPMRCSASSRVACSKRCAMNRWPDCARSASTVTPSAACPSANRGRTCYASSRTSRRACPRLRRAT